MSNKKPKPPWADEPTPLCNQAGVLSWDADDTLVNSTDRGVARDLERKLRVCQRHLKWVSRCATMSGPAGTRPVFVDEERMDKIKTLVEIMEQDGEIPLE